MQDQKGYKAGGSDLCCDNEGGASRVNEDCGPGRHFDGETTKKNKFKTMTPESDYKSNLGSSN